MGLSGPSRRRKIEADPNNTAWANASDGFGHRLLSKQGWQPGQTLGARDAPHAEHFTAASKSYIRVALRQDNLGLGADLSKSNADTFGLSTLSSIFGRLNGRSDAEVQKLANAQRDLELKSFQARRYGFLDFVSGGLLVGNELQMPGQQDGQKATTKPVAQHQLSKRKRDIDVDARPSSTKKAKTVAPAASASKATSAGEASPRLSGSAPSKTGQDESVEQADAKALRRAEKQARKEERRRLKEAKASRTPSTPVSDGPDEPAIQPAPSKTEPNATTAKQGFAGSRHAVRQRYIQQKRLASMDARALNEILMLSAAVS